MLQAGFPSPLRAPDGRSGTLELKGVGLRFRASGSKGLRVSTRAPTRGPIGYGIWGIPGFTGHGFRRLRGNEALLSCRLGL